MHSQVHLTEPKMYLFDLELNPSENVEEGCGTDKSLGRLESCANLYSIPAFRDTRRKLEGMLMTADRESVAPTLRWEDDGPLADPQSFGGWIPWRDRNGDPLAVYSGVVLEGDGDDDGAGGDSEAPPQEEEERRGGQTISLAGVGPGGAGAGIGGAITMTASYASGLAMFIAIFAVGSTFLAYRAGQRSGYRVLR